MPQEELPFMNEYRKNEEGFQILGRAVAHHAILALREPLEQVVDEAVEAAIARQVGDGMDTFVKRCLEYRFQVAMEEYWGPITERFNEIAESYRRDENAADWWKTSGEEDD